MAAPANPVARTLGVASVLKDARKAAVRRGPVMGTGKRRGARRSRKRASLPGFGGAFGAKNRFSPAGRWTGITAQRPKTRACARLALSSCAHLRFVPSFDSRTAGIYRVLWVVR